MVYFITVNIVIAIIIIILYIEEEMISIDDRYNG
jgi:hypothetical protein